MSKELVCIYRSPMKSFVIQSGFPKVDEPIPHIFKALVAKGKSIHHLNIDSSKKVIETNLNEPAIIEASIFGIALRTYNPNGDTYAPSGSYWYDGTWHINIDAFDSESELRSSEIYDILNLLLKYPEVKTTWYEFGSYFDEKSKKISVFDLCNRELGEIWVEKEFAEEHKLNIITEPLNIVTLG